MQEHLTEEIVIYHFLHGILGACVILRFQLLISLDSLFFIYILFIFCLWICLLKWSFGYKGSADFHANSCISSGHKVIKYEQVSQANSLISVMTCFKKIFCYRFYHFFVSNKIWWIWIWSNWSELWQGFYLLILGSCYCHRNVNLESKSF